jgi:cysteine-rich repeat protein
MSARRIGWICACALAIVACKVPNATDRIDIDASVVACGNGMLEPPEVCDDGNTVGGDGCSADCTSDETCGNGIIDPNTSERCDDGNTVAGDNCSADCTSDETCGNGVKDVDRGETCDDGNNVSGDGCSATCQSNESCGNGIVDTATTPPEQCDSMNQPTSMCDPDCTRPVCHDGIINHQAGEDCEDANGSNLDACRNDCKFNVCGDGFRNPATEQCDDGNTMNGDTCSSTCKLCTTEICGDGIDQNCDGFDPACPSNDAPANAIDISGGGMWTVDLSTAHDDITGTMCGNAGGRDAFYQFSLPNDEVVYLDTFGSNFDILVKFFSGTCDNIIDELGCDDDACGTLQSQGAGQLPAGDYCVVVDQISANETRGSVMLTFRRGGRTGSQIPLGAGLTQAGDTSGGSDQMSTSCGQGDPPDDGYWFLSCPGDTLTIDATTCNDPTAYFDTVLSVRSAANVGNEIDCNDDDTSCVSDTSTLNGVTVTGPDLHWLVVDGYDTTDEGPYLITYSIQ